MHIGNPYENPAFVMHAARMWPIASYFAFWAVARDIGRASFLASANAAAWQMAWLNMLTESAYGPRKPPQDEPAAGAGAR